MTTLRASHWPIHETLLAGDTGGTLFLKLCGFIDEHRAIVRNVWDDGVALRLSRSRGMFPRNLDMELRIRPTTDETDCDLHLEDWQRSHSRRALVDIRLRPSGWCWGRAAFQEEVRKTMWLLRWHLFL